MLFESEAAIYAFGLSCLTFCLALKRSKTYVSFLGGLKGLGLGPLAPDLTGCERHLADVACMNMFKWSSTVINIKHCCLSNFEHFFPIVIKVFFILKR